MNENYIPEEEDVLEPASSTDTLTPPSPEPAMEEIPEPTCEAVPEDFGFEAPSMNSAPEAASEEEHAAIEAAEMLPLPEVNETPAEPVIMDAEVTDIILDTLAEQEPENELAGEMLPLDEARADELIEELTEELSVEERLPQEQFDDGGEFRQMFEQKIPDPIPPQKKERPVRKGRPRRQKGSGLLSIPHMLSVVIWLLIIVAVGTSLGRIIWVCAADVLAFGRESKEVSISITADDTMESITEKLHEAGLIEIPELFLFFAELTGVEEENKLTTGTFTLNTVYDYNALIKHMGPRATNRVVIEDVLIPEGYNCRQIFALLEEKGICKAADLEAYAASGELDDYWFLEGVERGSKYCLEGFLFPDTYDFYENSTPKLALEKMLDGFQYRFTEELYEKLPVLNERITEMMRKNGDSEEYIAEHQLTLQDLLTVASMIEEETASNAESYRIASVIYNRLFSWGDTPRYLGIDATIIYALDGKTDLTAEDLAIDSPYNTRNHAGLTPGPITNPGLASIEAALNPEDTNYYYYVIDLETGMHVFAKTLDEHTKNVEKYKEHLLKMEQEAANDAE